MSDESTTIDGIQDRCRFLASSRTRWMERTAAAEAALAAERDAHAATAKGERTANCEVDRLQAALDAERAAHAQVRAVLDLVEREAEWYRDHRGDDRWWSYFAEARRRFPARV